MKKKTIVFLSVVGAIIVLAVIASIILFAPKRLANLVSVENIVSVSIEPTGYHYAEYEYGTLIELTGETKEAFLTEIKNGKYKLRFLEYLTASRVICHIRYGDGTKIVIADRGTVTFYNAEGEVVRQLKVYLLADFNQFVPPK